MSLPPVEIPLGAMRFNSDSQKLEYWNGSAWFQIQTFSPTLNGGARGLVFQGIEPSIVNSVSYVDINKVMHLILEMQQQEVDLQEQEIELVNFECRWLHSHCSRQY